MCIYWSHRCEDFLQTLKYVSGGRSGLVSLCALHSDTAIHCLNWLVEHMYAGSCRMSGHDTRVDRWKNGWEQKHWKSLSQRLRRLKKKQPDSFTWWMYGRLKRTSYLITFLLVWIHTTWSSLPCIELLKQHCLPGHAQILSLTLTGQNIPFALNLTLT